MIIIRKGVGISAVSAYQGPGDVATSGWIAWGGMRAFSAAKASTPTNAIDLRYTDATVVTYQTQADGTINLAVGSNSASHATNITNHGGPATISKWYDQTGNGNDISQSTVASQPTFTTGALGSFPGSTWANNGWLESATNITQAQPLTFVAVGKNTVSETDNLVISSQAGECQIGISNSPADNWFVYAGGAAGENNTTGTTNAFHAAVGILNGTSSNSCIDGVDHATGGNIGTSGFSSLTLALAGIDGGVGGSMLLTGVIMEWGLNGGNLSSLRSALNTNMHNGYGF